MNHENKRARFDLSYDTHCDSSTENRSEVIVSKHLTLKSCVPRFPSETKYIVSDKAFHAYNTSTQNTNNEQRDATFQTDNRRNSYYCQTMEHENKRARFDLSYGTYCNSNTESRSETAASKHLALRSYAPRFPSETKYVVSDKESYSSNVTDQNTNNEQRNTTLQTDTRRNSSFALYSNECTVSRQFSNNRQTANAIMYHFPIVLMDLLTDEIHQDQLSFLPDGKSFVIKRESFTRSLMPTYFNLFKFRSFLIVLKRWGFTQVKRSTIPHDCILLFHLSFQKDNIELMRRIKYMPKIVHWGRNTVVHYNNSMEVRSRHSQSNLRHYPNRSCSTNQDQKEPAFCKKIDSQPLRSTPTSLSCDRITTYSTIFPYHAEENDITHGVKKNVIDATVQCLLNAEGHTHTKEQNLSALSDKLDGPPLQCTPTSRNYDRIATCSTIFPYHIEKHDITHNFTKNVIDAAVQCLFRDENHPPKSFDSVGF